MPCLLPLSLTAAVLLGLGANATANDKQPPSSPRGQTASVSAVELTAGSGPLTPGQRGEMARQFVTRWAPYYESVYGESPERWAMKQASSIGRADADNLRRAMHKETLEAAVLAINGQDMSDDSVIDHLAANGESGPLALGDLAADLVFTPLAPCRVFDTRLAVGQIVSSGSRSFDLYPYDGVSFVYQGGSATSTCGINPDAAAVALNIAAPNSSVGGYLTVYPYNTTRPLASNLDYKAGDLANNEIIAKSANAFYDITVYAHGTTHVVGDVVGYFMRPQATALDCVETSQVTNVIAAGGTGNVFAPSCAAGYSKISTNCESSSYNFALVVTSNGLCAGKSSSAFNVNLSASQICCRVPGR